jgi:hypothetical protein
MLAMTCTHSLRIVPPGKGVMPAFGKLLMDWEPVIPTVFTLLLGYGLAVSAARSADLSEWRSRQRRRALWLWLLSSALFFVRFGPQWPELLISTGILQCLAISILAVSVVAPSGGLALGWGASLFLAWTSLEGSGLRLDGLNQGSFPVFPYLPYALLSFGAVRLLSGHPWRQFLSLLAGTAAAFWMRGIGWGTPGFSAGNVVLNQQTFLVTGTHLSDGFTLTRDLFLGVPGHNLTLSFWHTLPPLALFLLVACAVAAFLLSWGGDRLSALFRPLSLPGRHSLIYYAAHFAGLGAFLLLPASLRSGPWTWLVASLTVFATASLLFFAWERFRACRKVLP